VPQTLFPHPNTKPAHYSTQHGRLKHMFSVFQLYITRGKRTPFARGASWVSLQLQTFFSPFPSKAAILGER